MVPSSGVCPRPLASPDCLVCYQYSAVTNGRQQACHRNSIQKFSSPMAGDARTKRECRAAPRLPTPTGAQCQSFEPPSTCFALFVLG